MRKNESPRNIIKAAFFLGVVAVFIAACVQQASRVEVPLTASETPEPVAEKVSTKTFQAFSHKIEEHKQFECASCHQREGKSLKMDLPGHESCIGCHLNQFTDKAQVMCSICHESVGADPYKIKVFPVKFLEGFNMKFSHAAHDSGKGLPPQGCSSCHQSSGPGKTIPVGFQAHNDCFGCHTQESKIGSCSVCHALAPYNRTLQSEYGFKYIFRHGDHTTQQRVNCDDCHHQNPGAPQSRQITNIAILEHKTSPGNNCLQCHNGRAAFNGNDPTNVASCTKCHKNRVTILPPDTSTE